MAANKVIDSDMYPHNTIEERNVRTLHMMENMAQLPKVEWIQDEVDGSITVWSDTQPISVFMWHANTCINGPVNRRDFRIANKGFYSE